MEDAMIINKSSYERGLMHGCVYKTEQIDLDPKGDRGSQVRSCLVLQRVFG
jgi:DNA-directed RNA polymerase beta subunit